jgi:4-amino-4-deoxy-L-arabinose transferase-like glycosyltransferase
VSHSLTDPLNLSAGPDAVRAAPVRPRRRWELWRSPDDQPPWARPVLLGIAAVAAALYAWNITSGGLAPFYSVAVKSMSVSWKAFFYGAFDPSATITIDKLAGSFLPQALSARIFGFSVWSLALPQVIEGVIAVLVMYRAVRRWAGPVPGILAAAIFTLTPIVASMFDHSMEDGALTLCLVLAADAYQRAVGEARLRSLLMAGVWVGLGFQAKMLQAWMVLPALAIGYLVTAPVPLRRRLWQLGVAGVVMLTVSLSWIALYTFTPTADRPYVDGSTNNSMIAMVFGYNGGEHFGISLPGALKTGPAFVGIPGVGVGWTKLFGSEYGPEIGWLYPLALLALVFGLAWTWRARRSDPAEQVRGGFVMWGVWLVTYGLIFSKVSTIPHTAYMASLAPPLAALAATGIVVFWRAYRAKGWRGWALPAAVAAEVAWALFLWRDHPGFLPWARDLLAVVGVLAVLALVALRLARRAGSHLASARLSGIALAAGVAAMLAAPATWATSVLDASYAGTSLDASAGPAGGFGDASITSATTLTSSEQRLYDYVSAHRGSASYLFAASSWEATSPYIIAAGQEVLPLGGFSGLIPSPALASVKQMVSTGQLKFFLFGSVGYVVGSFAGESRRSTASTIESWVKSACTAVPPADYGGSGTRGTLYSCAQS